MTKAGYRQWKYLEAEVENSVEWRGIVDYLMAYASRWGKILIHG